MNTRMVLRVLGYILLIFAALMLLPMQSIGLATTTFVGQNVGVGKTDRAIKGVRISILMSFIATVRSPRTLAYYPFLLINFPISPFGRLSCSS